MTWLAIMFAAASAATTALSTALQHHCASSVVLAAGSSRTIGLLQGLLRRPAWLLALAMGPLGFTLHALALRNGPIALVQPIVIVGIVAALPLSTAFAGTRTAARELRAAVLTVAGLAVFLLASDPAPSQHGPSTWLPWAVAVTGAAAAACIILAGAVRRPAARAALLGTASGLLFGLMAVIVEVIAGWVDAGHTPVAVLTTWYPYAMATAGVGGLVVNQFAYRTASLAASMPILNVVNCLVTLAFGYLVLGERTDSSPWSLAVSALALAVIVRGLWVLSGGSNVEAGPDRVSERVRRPRRRTSSTSSPAGPSGRARAASGY